jgi:hypothetical protein
MVYYDGQNMDLRNYMNNFKNKLKNMNISNYDINFLINLMPVTIGCTFCINDMHIGNKNDMNIIYEIDLTHLNFHDISLSGIIHIESFDGENSFMAKNIDHCQKIRPNYILSPKKYYVKFEKEYMSNMIFDELSHNNISLCNYLITNFNCNKDDLQKLFSDENFNSLSIRDSIHNFTNLILGNDITINEVRMEFFDCNDQTSLVFILQNGYYYLNTYDFSVNNYNSNKKRKNKNN